MPSVNIPLNPTLGPIISVAVMQTQQRISALKKAGVQVPPPQSAQFLVDTGASHTCVDPSIIDALGITAKGSVSMQTPSTDGVPVSCPVYDVQLILVPSLPAQMTPAKIGHLMTSGGMTPHIRAISVMGAALKAQNISGLIGRDVLEHCLVFYNGHSQHFTIAW